MGPQNVKILGPWGPRILKFWGPGGPKMGGGALFSHDTGLFTFVYFTSKHLKSLSSYIVKCNGMPRSVSIGGVWNLLRLSELCVYMHEKYIHIHILNLSTLLSPCWLWGGLFKLSSIVNESMQ